MSRIPALDIARSLALLLMAVFHFTFDLEMFGLIAPGTITSRPWAMFADGIAGSFLFLSGVSLWLAHGRGLRWAAFWRRLAMVAGAAALVSLATWIAMPHVFVFFGILHCIALAGLIGAACLRLPAVAVLGMALAMIALPMIQPGLFGPVPWLDWTGLTARPRPAMDYVPVFPWAGWALAGLAVARIAERAGLIDALRGRGGQGRVLRWLAWPGRHSLAVYLLHQPILIGLLWLAIQAGLVA